MRWLLLSFLLCAYQAQAGQADAKPPEEKQPVSIAVVHTLAELLAQPKFTVTGKDKKKEIRVRLGVETDRAPAGSGLLIYAIADRPEILGSHEEDLGPVVVRVHREGAEKLRCMIDQVCRQYPEAPLYFFAKSIPFPVSGRYHIEAMSPDEKQLLASMTIEVPEASDRQPWYGFQTAQQYALEDVGIPWAGSFQIGMPSLPKIPGDEGHPIYAVGSDGTVEGAEKIQLPRLLPAVPGEAQPASANSDLDQRIAQLILQMGSEHYEDREQATRRLLDVGRRAEDALTQARTESDDPEIRSRATYILSVFDGPFTAHLENGRLVLEMKAPFDPASLETHLLARWWVNGKPLIMEKALQKDACLCEQIRPSLKAALAIDLKPLQLAATDQVEVEFLYCPMGTEEVLTDVMMSLEQARQLAQLDTPTEDIFQAFRNLRSNRLRFKASALKVGGDE